MIKLSHIVLALMLASCLVVTVATSKIFYDFSIQLRSEESLLDGLTMTDRFQQMLEQTVLLTEEKQHWVSTLASEIESFTEIPAALERAIDSAYIDSQSMHYEVLFLADDSGSVRFNRSTRVMGPEAFLAHIATEVDFVNDVARVKWVYDSGSEHQFIVVRRTLYSGSGEDKLTLYAGLRLTGKSGVLESIRNRLNADLLAIASDEGDTLIAASDALVGFSMDNLVPGMVSASHDNHSVLVVSEQFTRYGVFSRSLVSVAFPPRSLSHIPDKLKTPIYWLLALLLVYISAAFVIVKTMISKSVDRVLMTTHRLVHDEENANRDEVLVTRIYEFSQLSQNFQILAQRLRKVANRHLRAKETAIQQSKLLVLNQGELESQNKELSRLNAQMEQFVYSTSHDLKAPLTTIDGLADFAIMDLASQSYDEVDMNLREIKGISASLSSIIEDVISVMKAEDIDTQKAPVNLKNIVQSAWQEVTETQEAVVALRCDFQHEDPILCNSEIVTGIVFQLLSNAYKYRDDTQAAHYVSVRTRIVDGDFELYVSDNGVGIPAQFHGEVFKLFQRFDQKERSGSGLGLSLVKKYVEKLSGSVSFRSLDPGTEFSVRWPIQS